MPELVCCAKMHETLHFFKVQNKEQCMHVVGTVIRVIHNFFAFDNMWLVFVFQ